MPATQGVWRRVPLPLALLTDFINIEKPGTASDAQGGFTDIYTTLASNVRAIVQDQSPLSGFLGNTLMTLGTKAEHVTHRIWLRFAIAGLDTTCYVIFNSKRLRIHSINNFGGNTMIQAEEIRP